MNNRIKRKQCKLCNKENKILGDLNYLKFIEQRETKEMAKALAYFDYCECKKCVYYSDFYSNCKLDVKEIRMHIKWLKQEYKQLYRKLIGACKIQ